MSQWKKHRKRVVIEATKYAGGLEDGRYCTFINFEEEHPYSRVFRHE